MLSPLALALAAALVVAALVVVVQLARGLAWCVSQAATRPRLRVRSPTPPPAARLVPAATYNAGGGVTAVAAAPDGGVIAGAGARVRVFRGGRARPLASIAVDGPVVGVAAAPDGGVAVLTRAPDGAGGAVSVFAGGGGGGGGDPRFVTPVALDGGRPAALAADAGAGCLVAATDKGDLDVVGAADGTRVGSAAAGGVRCRGVAAGGGLIVAATLAPALPVLTVTATGRRGSPPRVSDAAVGALESPGGAPTAVASTADGRFVAVAARDRSVALFATSRRRGGGGGGRLVGVLPADAGLAEPYRCLAVGRSPDGDDDAVLVAAAAGTTLHLASFGVRGGGGTVVDVAALPSDATAVAWGEGGGAVIVGCEDGVVRVFDVEA